LGPKKVHDRGDGYFYIPPGLVIFFYTTHGEYGKRAAAYSVLENPAAAYQGLVDEVSSIQAKGVYNVDPTQRQRIYDYAISFLEGEEATWGKHQAGDYTPDIDLLMLEDGSDAHLSNAIAFAQSAPNGDNYKIFHCCHCRYVAPD